MFDITISCQVKMLLNYVLLIFLLYFNKMKNLSVGIVLIVVSASVWAQPGEGISGEGKMKDDHKVGKWSYTCDATGKLAGEEEYDGDGLLNGYVTWYDCDGNLLKEYNYKHGKKIGKQKEFYPVGRHVKREWSMMERPKQCQKSKADKDATDIDWYKSYYENGKLEVEWNGHPCGERKITKHRETGGIYWIIEYDIDGNYKHGPKAEEQKINNDSLR